MAQQEDDPRTDEELGKAALDTHRQTTKDSYQALKVCSRVTQSNGV
jgi:hypothetical protein